MKYKYETNNSFPVIKKVEIGRETEHTVWVKIESGRTIQNRKQSDSNNYFDTFEDAKNWLLENINREIKSIEENLKYSQEKLDEIIQLKELP